MVGNYAFDPLLDGIFCWRWVARAVGFLVLIVELQFGWRPVLERTARGNERVLPGRQNADAEFADWLAGSEGAELN